MNWLFGHYLPTPVKDRVILPFCKVLFWRNSASAKFRENKTLAKISEFTVCDIHFGIMKGGLISGISVGIL